MLTFHCSALGAVMLTLAATALCAAESAPAPAPWPAERAREWSDKQPWLVGCNFLPSTAVNDVEMWQKDTFDPATADKELAWAQKIGFNSVRVFLNYVVWKDDPEGFKKRFEQFLAIAAKHGISTMPIFFDDCAFAGKEPKVGKQDDPVPGVHNSGWVPSPGKSLVMNRDAWPDLEKFVKDVVGAFGKDARVVVWDLYNEPGNEGMGNKSLPLVEAAFAWAREVRPAQPLTVGLWGGLPDLNRRQIELSDIISFHNYGDKAALERQIAELKKHGRPVLCTEWMRRPASLFASHMPVFKAERVGCYNWGLVNGRTQTHFPWGSPKGAPEPKVWFHDLLRRDGTPFNPQEIQTIGQLAGILKAPEIKVLIATSQKEAVEWRYTIEKPADDWFKPACDDSKWLRSNAPFGTKEPEFGRNPGTEWKAADIWLRREVVLPDGPLNAPQLLLYHDEDAEVYFNGVLAATVAGYNTEYEEIGITPEARAVLKPGKLLLAVHCHQTTGGQYIDLGLVDQR
ncbi:MAG: cellulase family glycosylhydrolase [Planctomycetota bacterium]|nr:cellulase family glycosylhydrolase [Planctomycetota bacterium]